MAIVKNNYVKQGRGDRSRAKAHIRYIQHRPGKTTEHAQAHHRHRGFFCCGQFAENCDVLGMLPSLALALNPDYSQYHSRFCETHTSYYRLQGYSRQVEKLAQQYTVSADQPATDESKGDPVNGNGNERITRTLFGIDGAIDRLDAYRMIDSAATGSVFYRFVISPDPNLEDTKHDLSLREITETTMHAFEDHIHKQVAWVGAVHADHAPHRHVHVLAVVPGRLSPQDFRSLPQALIQAATAESQAQRRQLDQILAEQTQEREGEEAAWGLQC